MADQKHTLMDGKVHVYRRENSSRWQCAVYLDGYNYRSTTGCTNLALAFQFATDWYLERRVDARLRLRGEMPAAGAPARYPGSGGAKRGVAVPTFRDAAKAFVAEYEVITLDRSALKLTHSRRGGSNWRIRLA